MVLLAAINNFAIVPLTDVIRPDDFAAVLVYLCVGIAGAQAALHAIWCVLAPVGLARRLLLGLAAGLLLFGAWAIGYECSVWHLAKSFSTRVEHLTAILRTLLCLPLVAVGIQLPLWVARYLFRWHVVHTSQLPTWSKAEPFGIRDILVATGLVAVALSGARLAVPTEDPSPDQLLWSLLIGTAAASVISLGTTLPILVATLRARRVAGALSLALVSCCVVMLVIIVLGSLLQSTPPLSAVIGLYCVVLGFFGGMCVPLLFVRRLGFCLQWGRS